MRVEWLIEMIEDVGFLKGMPNLKIHREVRKEGDKLVVRTMSGRCTARLLCIIVMLSCIFLGSSVSDELNGYPVALGSLWTSRAHTESKVVNHPRVIVQPHSRAVSGLRRSLHLMVN